MPSFCRCPNAASDMLWLHTHPNVSRRQGLRAGAAPQSDLGPLQVLRPGVRQQLNST